MISQLKCDAATEGSSDLVDGYEHYSNPDFIHDFFGRMTREQVGQLAYKHTDHHLRPFGA
jgi:hypothetical protein